jgi:transposase
MKKTTRKKAKKKTRKLGELKNFRLNAAGIDVGSRSHFVAIPQCRDNDNVREFKTFQPDLVELCDWLKSNGVETVAMESTGVYWIPVFELLEERGFDVVLVNAHHIKNVPGRKSDVLDCQWIQQLHSYGLLSGSFRPTGLICRLRSVRRQRDCLIKYSASHIQHMQKALNEMNVLLHNVISNITGVSGLRIIKAIIDGERDPVLLANLRDKQCKSSESDIIKSLSGNYKDEHIFSLKIAYETYFFYLDQIKACGGKIESILCEFEDNADSVNDRLEKLPANRVPRKRVGQNSFNFDLRKYLYEKSGVDLTMVYGISEATALTVLSEIGFSAKPWPSSKHFCSWLALCPNNKKSGGKILSSKTKPCANKVATALRMAAMTIGRTQTSLGAYYRRIKARGGAPKAITAVAHKLARIIYGMLSTGRPYLALDPDYYEKKYHSRVLKNLKKRAESLGYQLFETEASLTT